MRHRLLLIALVVSACGGGGTVDQGSTRPEPAEPPSGPVIATTTVQDTTFTLHDEGAGCVAVEIVQPGLQYTVERQCFAGEQVVALTYPCGWLVDPPDKEMEGCDVTLPRVLFGQVLEPTIGYVCIGTIEPPGGAEGVSRARFVPFDDSGFVLEAQRQYEAARAHLFTAGGVRWGEPPLGDPSEPIYQLCEGLSPWGPDEDEMLVRLQVELGETLLASGATVSLDAGTGPLDVDASATEGGIVTDFPIRTPWSSTELIVTITSGEADPPFFTLAWPDTVQEVLDAEEECPDGMQLRLTVGDGALDGTAEAVTIEVIHNDC